MNNDKRQQLIDEYMALGHALQTGVMYMMELDTKATEPKHMRTGINMSKTDMAGLVKLLIDKGIITEEEYIGAIIEALKTEVELYENTLSKHLGIKITLG